MLPIAGLKQALLAAGYPAEDLAGYVQVMRYSVVNPSQAGSSFTSLSERSRQHSIRQDVPRAVAV